MGMRFWSAPIMTGDEEVPRYRYIGEGLKAKVVEEKVSIMLVRKVELSEGLIRIGEE